MANALQAQQKPTGIASYLKQDAVRENVASVVGAKNMVRFVTSIVSTVQTNPSLAECTHTSILNGALRAESSGLSLDPQLGQAYLVPYNNRKKINGQWVNVKEATFQVGWKGFLQLAIRSAQYKKIVVSEVKEGEIESYNPITEELSFSPILDPAVREATKTVGYFAMFRLLNNFEKTLYWSMETMQAHAKRYSRGYREDLQTGKTTSQWSSGFDAMAKKTMLKQLISKWGIMSVEMQKAYEGDQAVIDPDDSVRYVDNPDAVPIEAQVAEEIQANANAEEFVEAEVVEPVKEEAPAPKPRGRQKKQPEPEIPSGEPEQGFMPEPEAEQEVMAYEDYPDEPDFNS